MLNVGEIVKLNYSQSLLIGKIKEIGKDMSYILIVDVVFMVPVRSQRGQVEFAFHKDKSLIHFVGGGYFASVLGMDDELYKKYVQTMSGIIIVPGSKLPS